MPLTATITIIDDTTVSVSVGNTNATLYTLYLQTGEVRTQYSNVFANLPEGDHAIRAEQAQADGTTESDYQEFYMAGPAMPYPTTFTVAELPVFLQAVYNPMQVKLSRTDYKVGDLFFVEVWTMSGKRVMLQTQKASATLHRTLKVNGDGFGAATIDISSALATVFRQDSYAVPNTLLPAQKDESAYVAYYFTAGFIKYDEQNREVRVTKYTSPVAYALRGAAPLNQSGQLMDYVYQFDGEPVQALTRLPAGALRKASEPTLLAYFIALEAVGAGIVNRAFVQADMIFLDGTSINGYIFSEIDLDAQGGGLYLVDAKPQRLLAHPRYAELVKYSVYLSYFDDTEATVMTASNQFEVGDDIQNPVEVLFMNRQGGWDVCQFRRDRDTQLKTKASVFTSGYGTRTFQVDSSTDTTYYSGWLTQNEYTWLKELMLSPAVYVDNEYVRSNDATYKFDSSVGLTSMELTVSPEAEENSVKM